MDKNFPPEVYSLVAASLKQNHKQSGCVVNSTSSSDQADLLNFMQVSKVCHMFLICDIITSRGNKGLLLMITHHRQYTNTLFGPYMRIH